MKFSTNTSFFPKNSSHKNMINSDPNACILNNKDNDDDDKTWDIGYNGSEGSSLY